MSETPPDDAAPPWRSFIAKRLDRDRWAPLTTNASDDEIDDVLRDGGFDPATRRLLSPQGESDPGARTPTLCESRWVRIMADVHADGVWNQDGESCLADALPVSRDLRSRLLAWQAEYDAHDDQDGPFLDLEAFAAEGLAIARAVKTELPDWTVVYYDESKCGDYRGPRSAFEYEIILPEADS